MSEKVFLFLYPIEEYLDFSLRNASPLLFDRLVPAEDYAAMLAEIEAAGSDRGCVEALQARNRERGHTLARPFYFDALDRAIDLRYRKKGFSVAYAVFDDRNIPSDFIAYRTGDSVFTVGLDFAVHVTERADGTYPYADVEHILDQVRGVSTLRLAGFHLSDCVDKVAAAAHRRGLDVLVDEDLTELFFRRLGLDEDFDLGVITCTPHYPLARLGGWAQEVLAYRQQRPWLVQY